MKTCFKCKRRKPHSQFYRHKQMGDGYLNKCRECTRKDSRENRERNHTYYLLYDRARYLSNPDRMEKVKQHAKSRPREAIAETNKRHWANYPERRRARHAVQIAIRSGRLKKMPCTVCGDEVAEAHHPDYSKPLDVIWLCDTHHKEEHRRIRLAALIAA